MIISNIEEPDEPQIIKDLRQEEKDGKITNDEFNRIINEDDEIKKVYDDYYLNQLHPVATIDWRNYVEDPNIENVTYVENEKGEKFDSTMSPSRRSDANFIDGNKYSFYETFGLTKNTATDKLKVRVLYKEKPYIVELEKAE